MPLRGSHLQNPHHFRHQRPPRRPLARPLVRHSLHLHVELVLQGHLSKRFPVENPATGEVVTTLQAGDAETTVKAIKAAKRHSTQTGDGRARQGEELYSRSALMH